MFTRRHERELAEIKTLAEELDQRAGEALEQIRGIQQAHSLGAKSAVATEDRRPPSSESVLEGIREEIDALARRFDLPAGASNALEGLMRLVDWGRPNFVPSADPTGHEPDERDLRTPSKQTALGVLAESLAGLELEPVRSARRIADLGSGAGFPGLVLAIALPQARVALIERKPDRCSFLRRASGELRLDNVEVVNKLVEEWSEGAGACDVVTARKLGRLETIAEWSAPLLAPQGAVVVWPGTGSKLNREAIGQGDELPSGGLRLEQAVPLESESRKGKQVVKYLYLYRKDDPERRPTSGSDRR